MTAHMDREAEVVTRPLLEDDLPVADHVMRVAFGTFAGVPEPSAFFGDASWVRNRWKADPSAAYAAEVDGEVVGSGFAARWGSFAVLGPLTVRPDLWDRGIGGRLMARIIDRISQWGVLLAGLMAFPHSPKHIGLYHSYGFSPRFLTAIMSKPVESPSPAPRWGRYSQLADGEKASCLQACRSVTDSLYEGLDLTSEIRAIEAQGLGDTITVWDESELVGLAACHQGPETEAGSGVCYVKFAAVRSGRQATCHFDELLLACESLAAEKAAPRLVAGVNTSRQEAYERMLQRGFRTDILGIAMHRPNEPGFSRAGIYVLDDWR
jgi:GNAT superfamily N-acetyltransferase